MSIFKRKKKEPKHEHDWEVLHSESVDVTYIRTGWFIKPHEFKKMALAQLKRCRGCKTEVASVTEQPPKFYVDIRDIPEGMGDVDPLWYRSRFGVKQ
jgi:hypothetical protein